MIHASQTPTNSDGRRRRLSDAELTRSSEPPSRRVEPSARLPSIKTNWPETSKPIDRNTRLSEIRNCSRPWRVCTANASDKG